MSARSRLTGLLLVVACAATLLAAPGAVAAQPGSLGFKACRSVQIFVSIAGIECGTLVVPFDREDSAAGDIGLAVQRVPASGARKGVIVLLAGGPGQPALPAFEKVLAPLARDPALRGFELVAFDQRGTGQSQGLECPESEGPSKGGISAHVGACGEALGATRAFYTSQESVEDLDALRESLGGMPLSIWAVSYGTRVAGMYALEHPQGAARMVLDSAVPVSGSSALYSERVGALRRVLDEGVCGAGACRSFTHDAYADLVRLVQGLHKRPLRVQIQMAHGHRQQVTVTEARLLQLLLTLDLAPTVREIVPAAIAAAVHGDPTPLAQLDAGVGSESPGGESQISSGIGPLARSLSDGQSPDAQAASKQVSAHAPFSDELISTTLFASTYCVENQLPWSPESAPSGRSAQMHAWLASLPASTTAPFAAQAVASVSVLPWCLQWPATPAAPPAPSGISMTPTLILSGDDDLRAPFEGALKIAAGYSDAALLRIPDVGHSTVTEDRTGCAKRAMIQFLTAGSAPSSCPRSSEPQAAALPPTSLSDVPPGASRALLARTVAAVAASALEYLFGQTVTSGAGLASGYWGFSEHGLALHHLSDTAGVMLSGTIHLSGTALAPMVSARLRIGGRISGELTLHGLTLAGSLAGTPVHAQLGAF
jgi:pimeloyl-ACP methyl ester carboxylesterase